MAVISGIWMFNEKVTISGLSNQEEYAVNFTCNGVAYNQIQKNINQQYINYRNTVTGKAVQAYRELSTGAAWLSQVYRTVDFGTAEQTVDEGLFTLLSENAKHYTPTTVYGGKVKYGERTIASLEFGQKADLNCDGQVMDGDVTVEIGSPGLCSRTLTANGTYSPPEGVGGWNEVTVKVPNTGTNKFGNGEITVTDLEDGQTYLAADDDLDGYSSVKLHFSSDIVKPSGNRKITKNGIFPVKDYLTAEVALPLGEKEITQNGTYYANDYTDENGNYLEGFSSVIVNIPNGGASIETVPVTIVDADGCLVDTIQVIYTTVNSSGETMLDCLEIRHTDYPTHTINVVKGTTIQIVDLTGDYKIGYDSYDGFESVYDYDGTALFCDVTDTPSCEITPNQTEITSGGGGSALETCSLMIYGAGAMYQQMIPYIDSNGKLVFLTECDSISNCPYYDSSTNAATFTIPKGAVIMKCGGELSSITYGSENIENITSNMNIDFATDGQLQFYKITGDVEVSW